MTHSMVIVGAGIGGLALALLLARAGRSSQVIEARHDPSLGDSRRSINLALSERGRRTLDEIGLTPRLAPHLIAMYGRTRHDVNGGVARFAYDLAGARALHSLRRDALMTRLLDAARDNPRIDLRLGETVATIDLDARRLVCRSRSGRRTLGYDLLIGADGAGSHVAAAIDDQRGDPAPRQALDHGYKEVTLSARDAWRLGLELNALHVWPREDYMAIALPCSDGRFAATLFLPHRARAGVPGFDALARRSDTEAFLAAAFPDIAREAPHVAADLHEAPAAPILCRLARHWTDRAGHALVIGDAAHAMAPFLGQGMNCALEDCRLLAALLADAAPADAPAALARFAIDRRPDAAAICRLSADNYGEMRRGIAAPAFARRRALEGRLQTALPDRFVPRYAMIAFTTLPYATLADRADRQEALIDDHLARHPDDAQGAADDGTTGAPLTRALHDALAPLPPAALAPPAAAPITNQPPTLSRAAGPSYTDYLALDTILAAQRPLTDEPTEVAFITLHQAIEMMFALVIRELALLTGPTPPPAHRWPDRLDNATALFQMSTRHFALIKRLVPRPAFHRFRDALTPASGLQSLQFRQIEFMCAKACDLAAPSVTGDATKPALDPTNHLTGAPNGDPNGDPAGNRAIGATAHAAVRGCYWHRATQGSDTLAAFDTQHGPMLAEFATRYAERNLSWRYDRLDPAERRHVAGALGRFDRQVNQAWRKAHLALVRAFLSDPASGPTPHASRPDAGSPVPSTAGLDWDRYLTEHAQGLRFFPQVPHATAA
ncbi:hypothetical protein CCR85_05390 [Rhodothalassium salexigens]|nr:hypothetical protein [Rhodothalassium salexigens]